MMGVESGFDPRVSESSRTISRRSPSTLGEKMCWYDKIPIVTQREIAGCCSIRIVLHHGRIQEPVRSRAVYRETHCVLAPCVLSQQIGIAGSETPSSQHRFPMKAEP